LHSIFFSTIVIALPFVLLIKLNLNLILLFSTVLIATLLACWIVYYLEPSIRKNPTEAERWRWQGSLAGVCSLLGLLPLLL
jgi:4-hydroxybenzoate polyprenyltransferase